ncbi:hypothetical protein IQ251_10155 [Saccharopolyspora sp. HNM0983]|uniref:Uncharacterized protein n=1 Tax=Saccharopolyspora montiporae TaxID=2781240 RepID=A0A929B9L9_9PSEU|nr:hypothetical protein [Saccharopolyspora sp. HNM0983]MBE9374806.1 hypothetical protein [Saccharopolyspora sp. HNM0983]
MNEQTALAVLLRAMQWELDHAAFEVGGGRLSGEERLRLAERLRHTANHLQDAITVSPNDQVN